jgi:sigma-B regulation protein RsbU (phosphoserine phosphatase)
VNKVLVAESADGMFVTLFYGILNTRTGEVEFAVGGHNPPYVLSEGGVRPLPFEGGMVVGISQGVSYKSNRIQLQPGEGLFLFTDGLTEATNEAQDMFSEERLEAILQSCSAQPLRSLVASVTEEVWKFVGGAPQADDLTIMTVRYRG